MLFLLYSQKYYGFLIDIIVTLKYNYTKINRNVEEKSLMSKWLQMIGVLILVFILISNYIDIALSNTSVIILGVLCAVLWCIGIFIDDKDKDNHKS